MNNDNNSKSVENIVESDVNTTEIIVDDINKINETEKRKKKSNGKLVVNNKKKKVFILADSTVKHFQGW